MAFIVRRVQGEDSWICSACKSVVQNFIKEDVETAQDYLEVMVVEPDEEMTSLRETLGMEDELPSVVENCNHDRYFRRWCKQWRMHRNRIDTVSEIVDIRLKDLNECLNEWHKITQEYEEAGNDTEKKRHLFGRVFEFRKVYNDILTKEGPGADETFKREMDLMRRERDHLLGGVPKIRQGILALEPPCRTKILKIIKGQADKFEASGVQPTPNEWTIVNFYKELKAACAESENAAIQNAPQGSNILTDAKEVPVDDAAELSPVSKAQVKPQTSLYEESDTLFVDTVGLLKLFSTAKTLPMTDMTPSTSQAAEPGPTQPAASGTTKQAGSNISLTEQIDTVDVRIQKIERNRQRVIKSISNIKKKIGETVTETETDEDTEESSSMDSSANSASTHAESSEISE